MPKKQMPVIPIMSEPKPVAPLALSDYLADHPELDKDIFVWLTSIRFAENTAPTYDTFVRLVDVYKKTVSRG